MSQILILEWKGLNMVHALEMWNHETNFVSQHFEIWTISIVQSVSRFNWKLVWYSKPPYFNGSVPHKWNRHIVTEEKYEVIGNMIVFYYYT